VPRKSHKQFAAAIRWTICATALWFALRSLSLAELREIWLGSDRTMLATGTVVFLVVPLLQAVRLRWLLRLQQVEMGWRESIRLAFAGNFLNFAAPLGSTAGDVYKAWVAGRNTPRKTEAAATVFVDRGIGLATLLVSVGILAAASPFDSHLASLRPYFLTLLALLIGGGLVYVSPFARRWSLLPRIGERLPLVEHLKRIDATMRGLLSKPVTLLGAVLITLVLQVFAAAAFACVAFGLGLSILDTNPAEIYAYFSAGELVKAIPGPPQGLGTMELAYQFFFTGLGSTSQIVSAAVAMRLVNLVCALPGAAFVAEGGRRRVNATPGTTRPASTAARTDKLAAAA
jgi:uncharacterized protein (TIRG00374 family)